MNLYVEDCLECCIHIPVIRAIGGQGITCTQDTAGMDAYLMGTKRMLR